MKILAIIYLMFFAGLMVFDFIAPTEIVLKTIDMFVGMITIGLLGSAAIIYLITH